MSHVNDVLRAKLSLKSIKLSGFKSFVDTTILTFPSALVGIVGPNGCGKSNIIDAIRWVMGESSAKSLRAETGIDVIFNGSTDRKPVSQALVELIFDNPEGAITGEYSQFRELSVKRVLDREGQSHYFINRVRCRRRDITDLFAGTGLGPRSYAVIEQGMISRIIEAKPEELRTFLEEAAGISRYHERRRETELSIAHTRDNLTRLDDLQHELGLQQEKLAEQAKVAEQYQGLQQQLRLTQQQLLTKQWFVSKHQEQVLIEAHEQIKVDVDVAEAGLAQAEVALVDLREQTRVSQEKLTEQQAYFYQLGTDVGRIEEQITAADKAFLHNETSTQHIQQEIATMQEQQSKAHTRMIELQTQLDTVEPTLVHLQESHEDSEQRVTEAEAQAKEAQQILDQCVQQMHHSSTQAQIAQTKLRHLEQNQQQNAFTMQKLVEEQAKWPIINQDAIAEIEMRIAQETDSVQAQEAEQIRLQQHLQQISAQMSAETKAIETCQRQCMQHEAKLASLEALQQAALSGNNEAQQRFLVDKGLHHQRLGQALTVTPTWRAAVESLLGEWLQALVLEEALPDFLTKHQDLPSSLWIHRGKQPVPASMGLTRLTSVLGDPSLLPQAFHQVYLAHDIDEAKTLLTQLPVEASVLCQNGLWLSRTWIRVPAQAATQEGILARAESIATEKAALLAAQQQLNTLEQQLAHLKIHEQSLKQDQQILQQTITPTINQLAELRSQLAIKKAAKAELAEKQAHYLERVQACEHEQYELVAQIQIVREEWQALMQALDHHAEEKLQLTHIQEQHKQQLQNLRQQQRELSQQLHEQVLLEKTARTELTGLASQQAERAARIEALNKQYASLQTEQTHYQQNKAEQAAHLQEILNKRVEAEAVMITLQQQKDALQLQLDELTASRQQWQRKLDELRSQIAKITADAQAETVKQTYLQEQAQTYQYELNTKIPEENGKSVEQLNKQVRSHTNAIEALGSVNLAAIEEYQAIKERHTFLQVQQDDLRQALATLEDVIVKMDQETRSRLQVTYEQVNEVFQSLFPRVFGGGSAYLSLTDPDLLVAGITVMARPPGKKNSTIHLLSGGEKALTAIALIFAIFHLNPAPFCLLDEVDAPLDEANVNRYCQLIRDLSGEVQFIFISHNKVTMELADQLLGVTMKEPGVSRVVAVDLAQAEALIPQTA